MERVWIIRDALDWTTRFLDEKGIARPRVSAERLLSAATGLSRVEVYAHWDQPLAAEERARLRDAVTRRATGEPLQYVVGEVPFRHLVLKVTRGVFIPRPETEVLAGLVVEYLRERSQATSTVIDLCTGTGAIALSVAYEVPGTRVIATDVSEAAVDIARANAVALGLDDKVEVLCGDLFAPVSDSVAGTVDAVVANPPYIPSADIRDLPAEVAEWEPGEALDGGRDGLDAARRIADLARNWLAPGGMLALELDTARVDDAAKLMNAWYEGTRTVRDLTGRDRVVLGTLP